MVHRIDIVVAGCDFSPGCLQQRNNLDIDHHSLPTRYNRHRYSNPSGSNLYRDNHGHNSSSYSNLYIDNHKDNRNNLIPRAS
jgi:hypothetical protein